MKPPRPSQRWTSHTAPGLRSRSGCDHQRHRRRSRCTSRLTPFSASRWARGSRASLPRRVAPSRRDSRFPFSEEGPPLYACPFSCGGSPSRSAGKKGVHWQKPKRKVAYLSSYRRRVLKSSGRCIITSSSSPGVTAFLSTLITAEASMRAVSISTPSRSVTRRYNSFNETLRPLRPLVGRWLNLLRKLGGKVSRFSAGDTLVERLQRGDYGVLLCASRIANGSIGDDLLLQPSKQI